MSTAPLYRHPGTGYGTWVWDGYHNIRYDENPVLGFQSRPMQPETQASMAIFPRNKMPLKELAMTCRRVGVSLDAGIDIRKIWQNESQRGTPETQAHAEEVRNHIATGGSLSEALESQGEYYPPLLKKLVHVGEASGKLDVIFSQLAEHYENTVRLRKFFISKLTWPLIELGLALAVIGLLIWILGFTGTDVLGWGLVGTKGLVTYIAILAAVAIVGFAAFHVLRRVLGLRLVLHGLTLLPYVGRFFRTLGISRFAWVLGLASDTDTPIAQCVDMAIEATLNPFYTSHGRAINDVIETGRPVNEAVAPTGMFPTEFVDAIQVGEETGKLSETMLRMAKAYEEQVQAQSTIITTVAGFAVWAIVALFIIVMIFRLAGFYVGAINSAVEMTY